MRIFKIVSENIILYKLVLGILLNWMNNTLLSSKTYEYLWFLFLIALMPISVHKLHLCKILQNLFLLINFCHKPGQTLATVQRVSLEQQVIRCWCIALAGWEAWDMWLLTKLAPDTCHFEEELTTSKKA